MGVIIANNLYPVVEYKYKEKEKRIIPNRKKIDDIFDLIIELTESINNTTE